MSSKKKESNKEQARTTAKVTFTTNGWEDYQHWKSTDAKISQAIDDFVEECTRTPFTGTGKPEASRAASLASGRVASPASIVSSTCTKTTSCS